MRKGATADSASPQDSSTVPLYLYTVQ